MTDKFIEDLDLHAYVDGLLDDDPARKAAVEAYLHQSPEAMRRVEDFKAQNAALQKAFGPRIADPVPQSLYDALEGPPRRNGRRVALRAAAMTASIFAAAVTGWMLGVGGGDDRMLSNTVDRSYEHFAAAPSAAGSLSPGTPTAQSAGASVAAAGISLSLRAPDLSQAGYRLTQEWQVSAGGTQMIRLDYDAAGTVGMAKPNGSAGDHSFSVFFAPRWAPDPADMKAAERDGVSIVYWQEGPYISTLVTRMPPAEAERAAASVREAMAAERRQPTPSEPDAVKPRFKAPAMAPSPIQPSTDQVAAPAAQPPAEAVPLQMNGDSVQH